MKSTEYLNSLSDLTDISRSLLFNDLDEKIKDIFYKRGTYKFSKWKDYSSEDKLIYAYFELIYDVVERVFVLQEDGWIPEKRWISWKNWIDQLIKDPIFVDVHNDNMGFYHQYFESFITDHLKEKSKEHSEKIRTTNSSSEDHHSRADDDNRGKASPETRSQSSDEQGAT